MGDANGQPVVIPNPVGAIDWRRGLVTGYTSFFVSAAGAGPSLVLPSNPKRIYIQFSIPTGGSTYWVAPFKLTSASVLQVSSFLPVTFSWAQLGTVIQNEWWAWNTAANTISALEVYVIEPGVS